MSGSVSGPGPKRAWKLQEFVAHGADVTCLALGHKSGRVLVTGGEDKKVNLWAVGKPNCIMSLSGEDQGMCGRVIEDCFLRSQHWDRVREVRLHRGAGVRGQPVGGAQDLGPRGRQAAEDADWSQERSQVY